MLFADFFVFYNVTEVLSQDFFKWSSTAPLGALGGSKRKYNAWRPLSYQSVQLTFIKKKENIPFFAFKWGIHSQDPQTSFFQVHDATNSYRKLGVMERNTGILLSTEKLF